ncbi:sugar transferase [Paenibacillus qinlingensis]|uniref:Exopolysaccharide biosynthesis polyprenyl glycosylphosphotransferase n=1 Tax=Paenibacillus qinlingensis TaxID=1837343 RepID=A0ABU1P297_9BACL|nr:sugar transferase [Paenibacillus qinlingensis]MDR6553873.1 exopolysaccharide biosynthesis polyprenyl glycosylphosphotransferase [Paenibacillus qinlingensis]
MNSLNRPRGSKWVIGLLDFIVIAISYVFAYGLSFQMYASIIEFYSFLNHILWISVMCILTYQFFNLYTYSGRISYSKYYYNLVIAHVMIAFEWMLLKFGFQELNIPLSTVLIALILQLSFMIGVRSILFRLVSQDLIKKKALIIVKNSKLSNGIIQKVLTKGEKWFDVRGVIQTETELLKVTTEAFQDIELFIISPEVDTGLKVDLLCLAGKEGKEVLLIPEYNDLLMMAAEPQQIDDMLVYSIPSPHLSKLQKTMKRVLDLVISAILLICTSPIFLLMTIIIPLSSHGKAFFSQERIGEGEKPFKMLKFRSMVDNAEKHTGPVLATERDARITKLGAFIRATRIDELPQLINVIRGEMSVVGPRPERAFFTQAFSEELPHYTYRFMVKPGITGMAQVMGNYSTLPSDKLRYDLLYIKDYSLLLDLKILFQTILVVLHREQSKGIAIEETKAKGKIARYINSNANVFISKE